MPEIEGVVGLALLFLWVFAIFDVIASEGTLVRNLPKMAWLFIVILLPEIGSIAWLILGRPQHARFVPGSTERRPPPAPRRDSGAPLGPEDSPDFLRDVERRRLQAWEEDLKRREEEIQKRADEDEQR
ncbi:MAG: PLD nuclease N-terminal domain-containing protein [Actinomycetota bacterium]|nr:PLD nuclease N-terminal domain-containing protein [Actinomycetota bacterium]